jgi:hypothetical protein
MPMPPNDQPPAWFMAQWLNPENWEWDAERSRHLIVLRNHMVQIVTRKGIDWTWQVKRLRGFGFHRGVGRRLWLPERTRGQTRRIGGVLV